MNDSTIKVAVIALGLTVLVAVSVILGVLWMDALTSQDLARVDEVTEPVVVAPATPAEPIPPPPTSSNESTTSEEAPAQTGNGAGSDQVQSDPIAPQKPTAERQLSPESAWLIANRKQERKRRIEEANVRFQVAPFEWCIWSMDVSMDTEKSEVVRLALDAWQREAPAILADFQAVPDAMKIVVDELKKEPGHYAEENIVIGNWDLEVRAHFDSVGKPFRTTVLVRASAVEKWVASTQSTTAPEKLATSDGAPAQTDVVASEEKSPPEADQMLSKLRAPAHAAKVVAAQNRLQSLKAGRVVETEFLKKDIENEYAEFHYRLTNRAPYKVSLFLLAELQSQNGEYIDSVVVVSNLGPAESDVAIARFATQVPSDAKLVLSIKESVSADDGDFVLVEKGN